MFKLIFHCSKLETNLHSTFKLASQSYLSNSYQQRKLVTFLPSSCFQWNIFECKRKESCINHMQKVETKSTKFSYKNNLRNHWTTKCHVLDTSFSTSSSRQFSTTTVVCSSGALPDAATVETVVSVANDQYTNLLLYPDFPFIFGAEKVLHYLHELTGLSWWSGIMVTALVMRFFLLAPLTIYVHHNQAKLERLAPAVKEKSLRLKSEVVLNAQQLGWTSKRAKGEFIRKHKLMLRDLYIKENCHPMKNTAMYWLQFPLWISVSYALRNITIKAQIPQIDGASGFVSLKTEGVAWFPDLTAVDSTWILPCMMGGVMLLNIEMTSLNIPIVTRYRKWLTRGLRTVAVVMIPITSTVPSAMALYWVTSGSLGAVQNLLFDYSPFRRLIGLPMISTESNNPIKNLATKARVKYFNKEKKL
ncbi:cytochrome c oxidase assembly protein COX18, mitochondrial-like isoform X2 [Physella acuta]|nr:cytochrome c oxidase assembly protein COX18, mitochondrial-like isoform X2 [Physella acuta]XP_059155630.1 cytochrome c oxidase assembly protein COX18, mitochondrial-like isoform X2 [Physella acuta]